MAVSHAPRTADAIVEVGEQIVAGHVGGTASDRAAIVFVTGAHATDGEALRLALTDVLGDVPMVFMVGESASCDRFVADGTPGLVVLVVDDERPLARTADSGADAASLTAELLRDGVFGRACLLSSATRKDALSLTLLPSLDEARAVVVGVHAEELTRASALAALSSTSLIIGIADATERPPDEGAGDASRTDATNARAARANLEQTLFALKGALRRAPVRAVLVLTTTSRDERFFGVSGYDMERALDALFDLGAPVIGLAAEVVVGTSDDGAVALDDACVIAALLEA